MINYLKNKQVTRQIWEEIFKEDTKPFLDYYYSFKTSNNEILCKMINDKIVSMLHLNPYNICINDVNFLSFYIVAVATLNEHRKKGYMTEILKESFLYMYKKNVPFTFLRPAKKEIYLPFDFEYIYNHKSLQLNTNLIEKRASKDDFEMLANFTNDFLYKRFSSFCIRDINYMNTLYNEVKSENGDIVKLYDNNEFIGYYVYWGNTEKIVRAIFIDEKYTKVKETNPLVMGRIINLYSFFENFKLKNNFTYATIYLKINDNFISENNGYFKLDVTKNYSKIKPIQHLKTIDVLEINIQNLLSIFFGYKSIQLFTQNKSIIENFNKIKLLDNIFFDEEV